MSGKCNPAGIERGYGRRYAPEGQTGALFRPIGRERRDFGQSRPAEKKLTKSEVTV